MAFDFKKEYREFYLPPQKPGIVEVPPMNFLAFCGKDDANDEAARKKKTDFSGVEFLTYHEGLCVQCMHLGSYDDEPATVSAIGSFAAENGYAIDISDTRRHHEIYLNDPRKTEPPKLKTLIRHPVKRV